MNVDELTRKSTPRGARLRTIAAFIAVAGLVGLTTSPAPAAALGGPEETAEPRRGPIAPHRAPEVSDHLIELEKDEIEIAELVEVEFDDGVEIELFDRIEIELG